MHIERAIIETVLDFEIYAYDNEDSVRIFLTFALLHAVSGAFPVY